MSIANDQYRWATVVLREPFRIRLDGESEALPVEPESLVDTALLVVGQRVWVQMYQRRAIVLGASKGTRFGNFGQRASTRMPWLTAAHADQRNAPLKIVWFGDSVSEGWYCDQPTERRRAMGLLQDRLRFVETGPGWRPAVTVFNGLPANGTASESLDPGGALEPTYDVGLGLKALNMSGAGSWRQWGWTGDRIRVWFWRHNFVASNATVTIDDGTPQTLTGVGTNTEPQVQVWDSGALTRGTHTIRVTQNGPEGYSFLLEGVEMFDGDFDNGVRVYDGAHFGWTAEQWIWPNVRWKQTLAQINPQLVICAFGLNDAITYDAQTFEQNMTNGLFHLMDALGEEHAYALVSMPPRTDQETISPWREYVAANESVAQAFGRGIHINMSKWWRPSLTAEDGVHTTPTGQKVIASAVASELGVWS